MVLHSQAKPGLLRFVKYCGVTVISFDVITGRRSSGVVDRGCGGELHSSGPNMSAWSIQGAEGGLRGS